MPIKEFELDRRKLVLNGNTPYLYMSDRVLSALKTDENGIIEIVQEVDSGMVFLRTVKEK